MSVRVVLDPEFGVKVSKMCQNCGKLLQEIHVGATSVLMCRAEDHSTIIIEHPPGHSPIVFTRAGLQTKSDDEVLGLILGKDEDDATEKAFVCPFCPEFTTTSKMAFERHLEFEKVRRSGKS